MSWYEDVVVTSYNFYSLVERFFGLQFPVFGSKLILSTLKMKEQYAYARVAEKEIVLNYDVYHGTHPSLQGIDWTSRLEVVNGILLHEVSHIVNSPLSLNDLIVSGQKPTKNYLCVCNCVEDVYVEHEIKNNHRVLFYFIDKMNKVIYNEETIRVFASKTTGQQPKNLAEAEAFLNFLFTFHRYDLTFTFRSKFEEQVYKKLISVSGLSDVSGRAQVVKCIYDMIFGELEKHVEPETNTYNFTNNNSLESSLINQQDLSQESPKKTRKTIISTHQVVDTSYVEGANLVVKLKKLTTSNQNTFDLINIDFSSLRKTEESRGSVRSVKGEPSYSGNKITSIHRGGSDGKVFGQFTLDGYRSGKGNPEIIFIIDCSGSMSSAMSNYYKTSRFAFALSACYGINNALSSTKVKYAIYGHTLNEDGRMLDCNLFEFKGFSETVSDEVMKQRIYSAYKTIEKAYNADPAVLLYASKLFSKSCQQKVMVVISDGMPSSSAFSYVESITGLSLIGETKEEVLSKVVGYLRKSGIKLFSAAIDKEINQRCCEIYGKDNNVLVTEPENLVKLIIRSLS